MSIARCQTRAQTATRLTAPLEQGLEQPSADALSPVWRGYPDLVDPEFGRLVGMEMVDRRCHPDNHVAVERDRQVMPPVGEELGGPARVDRVVEDLRRNAVEQGGVPGAEKPDGRAHRDSVLSQADPAVSLIRAAERKAACSGSPRSASHPPRASG